MKLSVTLLLATTSASAFVAHQPSFVSKTQLSVVHPDASAAIEAAVQASKNFGPTSPEARVAWDVVEEISAADNSEASKGTLDDECDWMDENNRLCLEYDSKKEELAAAIKSTLDLNAMQTQLERIKAMAEEIQAIKITAAATQPVKSTPQISAALQAAKDAVAEFGADSTEAKMAWETLEEISSSGLANSIGKRMDDECLVETAMEACMALDELNRVMNLDKTKNDSGLNA